MLVRHIGFRRLCLARDMLLESAEAPRPIADIARDLGISPSHLIRQFEATRTGPVTIAIMSDTCGSLIQLYQPA